MLGEREKSSAVCRTASLSEMGHEQRAATSCTSSAKLFHVPRCCSGWHCITSHCTIVISHALNREQTSRGSISGIMGAWPTDQQLNCTEFHTIMKFSLVY